ncbi:MAG: O-antigen ligase family protein, partial [Anaerolineae bacterium]|nr:O-antigen ligase family protein [Anaerolineae bacterium]
RTLILLLSALTFGLLLAALFASQSRGGWLAFAVAALVTIVAGSRRPGILVAGLVALGATAGLIGAFEGAVSQPGLSIGSSPVSVITQRLVDATEILTLRDIGTLEVTDANFSTLERLAHWQAARDMWRDHPWLGVGFGNYAAIYPAYAVGRWLDPLGHAHNYLLNIGAEAGLIGITTYLIFWILTFGVTLRAIQRSNGFHRAAAVGVLGIFTHLHIHNLFDNLYVQGMYLHLAVIFAVISIIIFEASAQQPARQEDSSCSKP